LDKNKTEIDKLKSEITNKEKEVNTLYEKYTPKPKEPQEPKLGKGRFLKKNSKT
jgi:hypothetical protein